MRIAKLLEFIARMSDKAKKEIQPATFVEP